MTPTPLDVFPASAADLTGQFLGRDVVQHLGHHFAAAAVTDVLKVCAALQNFPSSCIMLWCSAAWPEPETHLQQWVHKGAFMYDTKLD